MAAAVAELVGADGQVVGVDVDARMLERARDRTKHLPQVRFVEADVTRWRGAEPFDAVVGRLILFHVQDPVVVLRRERLGVSSDRVAGWSCSTSTSGVCARSRRIPARPIWRR